MPKVKKLPPSVQKALEGSGVAIPQVAELVGHFIQIAGGTRTLAKMMMEEYLRARSGSIMRQRILDTVMRMLTFANQSLPAVEETDLISTEDLEAQLGSLLEQIPDGEEEEGEGEGAKPGPDPESSGPQDAAPVRPKRVRPATGG